jgi:hypothetical protein
MKQTYAVFLLGLLLAACAAPPQLDPRPGGNPLRVDLSGQWMLRGAVARPAETEQTIRIPSAVNRSPQYSIRPERERSRRKGASVHIFLESGAGLKITQTDYGLFFSFDRAIVEEYAFGENRIVNIGPIEAQRVAGWEGRAFVIETMDEKGNVLFESWSLEDDGSVLVRELRIIEGDELAWSSRQVFDRE